MKCTCRSSCPPRSRKRAMPSIAQLTANARSFWGKPSPMTSWCWISGMPKLDGLTVLRRWRDAGLTIPVLVLTARGSWYEKVQGIDAGADDYLSKPFRMEELLARLRGLIRRIPPHAFVGNAVGLSRGRFEDWPRERQRSTRASDRARISCAVIPDASQRTSGVARRTRGTHLSDRRGARLEHDRGVHREASTQTGSRASSTLCADLAIAIGTEEPQR